MRADACRDLANFLVGRESYWTSCDFVQYICHMNELTPSQWIAKCGETLHERWHTVETAQLEEVAVGIWQDTKLRSMSPEEAATTWLRPVVP